MEQTPAKRKIIIQKTVGLYFSAEREVKRPEVTQAIEVEINAVNHDKKRTFSLSFHPFVDLMAFSIGVHYQPLSRRPKHTSQLFHMLANYQSTN